MKVRCEDMKRKYEDEINVAAREKHDVAGVLIANRRGRVRVEGRGSRVEGRGSRVEGRGSRVEGRGLGLGSRLGVEG